MPDKSKTASIDLLHKHFVFEAEPAQDDKKLRRPKVSFVGDIEAARRDSFLSIVDVSTWVSRLLPNVESAAEEFVTKALCGQTKLPTTIGTHCKDCEFRIDSSNQPSGFGECWGNLADVTPHILDYYYVGTIGGRGAPTIQKLLAEGKASLADVAEGMLATVKGEVGPNARRQRLQREYTLRNEEYRGQDLASVLEGHRYPLHFIDFEASTLAVPYHAKMHPYEQVCFQWSCHTISEPGATPQHSGWLNLEDVYPNRDFASSLAQQIGRSGTVYIWSPYEMSALKHVLEQFEKYGVDDSALLDWLRFVLQRSAPDGRFQVVDLCEIAKRLHFHPKMKGRLSIKCVLPAVWESNPALWKAETFQRYFRRGGDGSVLSPYDTLPDLPFADEELDEEGEAEAVRDGTAAMRAYQELLYGPSSSLPHRKEAWRAALWQYCELDTAAMVMIWQHWRSQA